MKGRTKRTRNRKRGRQTIRGGRTLTPHKQSQCSPFKQTLSYSCLSSNALSMVAKAVHKFEPSLTLKQPDKQLYKDICEILKKSSTCNTEACWLQIRTLMNQLSPSERKYFRSHFRPHMPEELVNNYKEWISNYNIKEVIDQYHNDLPEFYSYGAVPLDFRKCSVSSLCTIDIKKHINKGEHKIGIIFNTDESDEPGEHWIAMYIDIAGKNLDGQPGIYYFDSFGHEPEQEITDLIERITNQSSNLQQPETTNPLEFIVTHNKKTIQNNSFSCGFYCMHFMEHMIKEYPFKKYLNSGLSDKVMIDYQRTCYLHPDEIKY